MCVFCQKKRENRLSRRFSPQKILQGTFGGGNALHARINRNGRAEGAPERLEYRLECVMRLPRIQNPDVKIHSAGVGKRAEEFAEQRDIKLADVLRRRGSVVNQTRTSGKIKRDKRQDLVHRQNDVTVARDSRLVAERVRNRFPERKPGILHRVVAVDLQIAFHTDVEVELAVFSEKREHVIHERNTRGDARVPLSVKVDGYGNVGLFRRADLFCFSHKKSPVFGTMYRQNAKNQSKNANISRFSAFQHWKD